MPGKGVIITNWAKVTPAFIAISTVASKVAGRSVGRPKMNEPSTCTPCSLKVCKLLGQRFAGVVPVLVDGFQALGRHGFDAHQRALDIGLAHGVEIVAVFAGFHGDLGEEDHVLGQLGQLFHQLEALFANGGQLFELGEVVLLARQAQIGEGDGIEIVVGEGDEAEAEAAQIDDLVDYALIAPLPGLLPVGAPHAAERAMLGAAANGLHGGPHVFLRLHQVPARRKEIGPCNAAAFIDAAGMAGQAIAPQLWPRRGRRRP